MKRFLIQSIFGFIGLSLLVAGCHTPPKQMPIEEHNAVLNTGGTVILVQAHRSIHAPRQPYVQRFPGLAPQIDSKAFDLDSLTPNSSGSLRFKAFAPAAIKPVTLDPGSAQDGWHAFLVDPGSYIVDFKLAGSAGGGRPYEKLSALIIVPEDSRLVYVGSFEFHIDTDRTTFGSTLKGYSRPPLKLVSRLADAQQVASLALPEFGPPDEVEAVLYGSALRPQYHQDVYPLEIIAYDPGEWMSPDLNALWASRLAETGLQVASTGGSAEVAIAGAAIALLGGAVGGIYGETQEKAWAEDFERLAQTLDDFDATRQIQLELLSILKDGGPTQAGEVIQLWKAEDRSRSKDTTKAALEVLPLFIGFNTYGPKHLATSLVVRVRFRPARHATPVYDQVVVYTQNYQSLPFFMVPVPSVGEPFPFERLRQPDATAFLEEELRTGIRYISEHVVRDLLIGGRGGSILPATGP